MSRRVVISGLGTVGPWGADRAGLMAALTAGAAPLTPFGPAVGRLSGGRDGVDATPLALPPHARWAGVVDGSCLAPWVPGREARRMSRPSRFAVAAARAALADADFAVPDGGLDDLGVILSTAYGPAAVTEELLAQILLDGPEAASPFLFAESVANAPAAQVARLTGARGANLTITQREAGALIAVRRAADAIAAERSERMFAGVADEVIPLLQALFDRFGELAPGDGGDGEVGPVARPFDRRRNGLVTAEGATVLLLEDEGACAARGGRALARVAGGGEAFDATAPRCGWGTGSESLAGALRRTLARAGLRPEDVDLVIAGASGSRAGDRVEALTLRAAWRAPRGALGALGGGQLAAAVLLAERWWSSEAIGPPDAPFTPDPELALVPHIGPLDDPSDRPGRAPGAPRILVQMLSSGGTASWLVLEALPKGAKWSDRPGAQRNEGDAE